MMMTMQRSRAAIALALVACLGLTGCTDDDAACSDQKNKDDCEGKTGCKWVNDACTKSEPDSSTTTTAPAPEKDTDKDRVGSGGQAGSAPSKGDVTNTTVIPFPSTNGTHGGSTKKPWPVDPNGKPSIIEVIINTNCSQWSDAQEYVNNLTYQNIGKLGDWISGINFSALPWLQDRLMHLQQDLKLMDEDSGFDVDRMVSGDFWEYLNKFDADAHLKDTDPSDYDDVIQATFQLAIKDVADASHDEGPDKLDAFVGKHEAVFDMIDNWSCYPDLFAFERLLEVLIHAPMNRTWTGDGLPTHLDDAERRVLKVSAR